MKRDPKLNYPPFMPVKPTNKPPFAINAPVIIIRPHLWSGCVGTVDHVDDRQMHVIRIIGKDGDRFSCVAWAEQLRSWPWGDITWSDKL